jgi:CRISPR-associated protein Cas1
MVNEFVYCPRLFFFEWVEGVFRESPDTIEGSIQHRRVDRPGKPLPEPEDAAETLRTQSVTLSSHVHRVIAKIDLLEVESGAVTPVDYKHGRPMETPVGLTLWPSDRVQMALQALVLRENGYRCDEAIVFYQQTRQRVRLPIDEALLDEAIQSLNEAWATAQRGLLPPPLVDSPKCVGCSLAPICLPDESVLLTGGLPETPPQLSLFEDPAFGHPSPPRKPPRTEVRRLMTPRDDLRPLYLNSQGFRVGKSGEVLQVKEKDSVRQEVRIHEICQVNLLGNIQISTQAIQALCEAEVPVAYFSQGGWFYGLTAGLTTKNIFLRRAQFRLAEEPWFALRLARWLVAGKIRNQRVMLMRNHIEPPPLVIEQMKQLAERAEAAVALDELLGIEGQGARLYFGAFPGLLKSPDDHTEAPFSFDFSSRNRRPPRDPVNALLSLAYSVLAKDLTITCAAVGFDPMLGFYHQPRFGRPALALDLMEPFRPLIADSAVLQAINNRMITARDFIQSGRSVALTPSGRKAFFLAYESRMDTLVTHPIFQYRITYRRMLEVQTRLLGRYLEGNIASYPVFVTR